MTLHIDSSYPPEFANEYSLTSGNKIVIETHSSGLRDTIANTFAIKDDRIDLFVFTAYEGLYLMKEKNFFAPLEESAVLQEAFRHLYLPLQDTLTWNGHLVGWYLDVSPLVQTKSDASVLQDNNLPFPETFDAFLDVCNTILDEDLLGSQYRMMDTYTYTQEDMLYLLLKTYLSSCQIAKSIPDFTNAHLLALINRITNEIPKAGGQHFESDEMLPVFMLSTMHDLISADMLPLPRVLDELDSAIETYAVVAIVNPYSKNKEAAIDYLEYCATHAGNRAYFYDTTMTEPILNPATASTYDRLCQDLDGYRQLPSLTQEQEDRVYQLEEVLLPRYARLRYHISPADIAHYAQLAQHLCVNEGSPFTFDDALRQYTDRYLAGSIPLEEFSSLCSKHFDQILREMK